MKTLWILGDQLSRNNAALLAANRAQSRVLIIESKPRASRVNYHKKKLVLIFSAMRHFAAELREEGWTVDYHRLAADSSFDQVLERHVQKFRPEEILLAEPNDWPMQEQILKLREKRNWPIRMLPTQQFIVPRSEFQSWSGNSRRLLMENHYRRVRKTTGYLMRGDSPEGDQWNYDAQNRLTFSAWVKKNRARPEASRAVEPDLETVQVMKMVEREFAQNPGSTEGFWLPVDRRAALQWLQDFLDHRLGRFGEFEDLMIEGEPIHFHSVLSPLLNLGLLTPQECIEAAITRFHSGDVPINSVEGFVRQILGWREFINGVYWLRMPEYKELNYLQASHPLPKWIYSGETEMNCLRQVIRQVVTLGYNHHIQRLMVLGNFFLLAGITPREVDRWYLEMYVDAYDWVMAANVYGMILFADGGFMSTKPYAAGSSYINKMSNYCKGCRYKPNLKTGPQACPFNYLYWSFYDQHSSKFEDNPRVRMMVQSWRNRTEHDREAVRDSASEFLEQNF